MKSRLRLPKSNVKASKSYTIGNELNIIISADDPDMWYFIISYALQKTAGKIDDEELAIKVFDQMTMMNEKGDDNE